MKNPTFGAQLREARERAGVTRAEIARRCGMLPPAITRLEDYSDNVSERTIRRYAKALGLRVTLAFEEER